MKPTAYVIFTDRPAGLIWANPYWFGITGEPPDTNKGTLVTSASESKKEAIKKTKRAGFEPKEWKGA